MDTIDTAPSKDDFLIPTKKPTIPKKIFTLLKEVNTQLMHLLVKSITTKWGL